MNSKRRLVVYVDDTLVRSAGTKRMPIPSVVAHVKELAKADAELYCWSTAGAEYARSTARELGIEALFVTFLPKPNVLIDDQDIGTWKRFTVVHPLGYFGHSRSIFGHARTRRYDFSSRSAVNPIPRLFGAGGCMS
jgi:hypothetical protein